MLCKETQDRALRICHPVPDSLVPVAAQMWWHEFGLGWRVPAVSAAHGVVALDPTSGIVGVMGLRDGKGGFVQGESRLAGLMFRPAPATADLVIDGIVVSKGRRGIGGALIAEAARIAWRQGRPGLRAEVRLANRAACAFYAGLGFTDETRGHFGWPWSGRVAVLRLPLTLA